MSIISAPSIKKASDTFSYWGLVLFVACTLFAIFWNLSVRYPYYFIFDMDHFSSLDVLVIQGGTHPSQINHTSMGMYWLMKWAHLVSVYFGGVSVKTIADVGTALNPALPIAEVTTFFRRLSPVLCLLTPFLLWASLGIAVPSSGLVSIASLLALTIQQGYFYHAAMIRSELYSLFYWAVAVFFFALGSTSSRTSKKLIVFAAVSAGLAFQTKFQVLFYYACLPCIYYFFREGFGPIFEGSPVRKTLASFNCAAVAVLMFAAWKKAPPVNQMTFADSYALNSLGILLLLISFALAIVAWAVDKNRFLQKRVVFFSGGINFANLFLLGLVLSLLLHFSFYTNFIMGFRYLEMDMKMLFFRTGYGATGSIRHLLGLFVDSFVFNPAPYVLHAVGLGFLFSSAGYREKYLAVALTLLAVLNSVIAVRGIPRDMLWQESLLGFLGVAYLLRSLQRSTRGARTPIAVMCLLVASAYQGHLCLRAPLILNSNYTNYGWDHPKVFQHLHNAQEHYRVLIEKYFLPSDVFLKPVGDVALKQASTFENIARIGEFPFVNQKVSLRNIGILSEGYRVFNSSLEKRVLSFPAALREAILVDTSSLGVADICLAPEAVNDENWNKFRKCPNQIPLNILARKDLKIYLFLDSQQPAPKALIPTDLHIKVGTESRPVDYRGFEITTYTELPQRPSRQYPESSFFVIQQVFSGR